MAVGPGGTLYVADSVGNDIRAVPDAVARSTDDRTGTLVTRGGDLNDHR